MQTEIKGTRKFIFVEQAAPIVHRQDEEKCTRFYYERSWNTAELKWKNVEAHFRTLGLTNMKPNSTRELTGHALDILNYLDQE